MKAPTFVDTYGAGVVRGLTHAFWQQVCPRAPRWRPRSARTAKSWCVASAIPKDVILKQTQARGVPKETAERVLSRATAALHDWDTNTTEFLTPPEAASLCEALGNIADLRVEQWGGYASAERTVLILAHEDIAESLEEAQLHDLVLDDLTALQINGNFLFDVASHPDYLGAILACGITRQKVGDIIVVGDRGAQVVVGSDVADFLRGALTSVRTVSVTVEAIPLHDLQIRPPSVKEMTVVEASMRLDAVASAGFGMSRSKLADLVKSGACQRNYLPVTQPAKAVQTGDVISVRGKGKLVIGEASITAKNRFRINLKRFV